MPEQASPKNYTAETVETALESLRQAYEDPDGNLLVIFQARNRFELAHLILHLEIARKGLNRTDAERWQDLLRRCQT